MDLELTGKRAFITGGSRGIGKAIARQLALEGVNIAIAARDRSRLDGAVDELAGETGVHVAGFVIDTGDEESVKSCVAAAAEDLDGIDILVNAAAKPGGQGVPPTWDAVTTADFFDDVNVKVMGYLRCAQQAAPFMIANGWGRIINISGLAARQAGTVVGSVRNVAVSAMAKNLADALGPKGINVTVIHPGTTITEATTPEILARPVTNVIGRLVDSSEIAYIACFLASPKSVAITGDTIAAGGGVPRAIYY